MVKYFESKSCKALSSAVSAIDEWMSLADRTCGFKAELFRRRKQKKAKELRACGFSLSHEQANPFRLLRFFRSSILRSSTNLLLVRRQDF
jgi:hypothetical protein